MKDKEIEKTWDLIISYGIATKEELQLVTNINGYNLESLNSVIYARTAYRNISQYLDEIEN